MTLTLYILSLWLFSVEIKPTDLPCNVQAGRVTSEVIIDGRLDEDFWKGIPSATKFLQRFPDVGDPASLPTEARVAYDEDYIYIGAILYDKQPDSVAATLFRKDGGTYSDWFEVIFDSYNDKRTGFGFAVNPRGVRADHMFANDGAGRDGSWEAVWLARSFQARDFWSVEIRIPFSQLRFDAKTEELEWGINFGRFIARYDEMSYWSHAPSNEPGFVSRFGTLSQISPPKKNRRLEIIPYGSGQLNALSDPDPDNPYSSQYNTFSNFGLDLRYGIGSDFTLTTTINPDFGQAEVDPAVVNLTAFEVFFPERRAFFLEGMDIYQFGDTQNRNVSANPQMFYSRRIGRRPQRSLPDSVDYADRPLNTTIAAASKFSGKTKNGLSVALLNAVTTVERAPVTYENGSSSTLVVEPAANYFVSRLRKDYAGGMTVVGGMMNMVHRSQNHQQLRLQLRDQAYVGGLDFEHSWKNRLWTLSGVATFSHIRGTSDVITDAQLSSARFFNRPDAEYLSLDSSRTSLSGSHAALSLLHQGPNWMFSFTGIQVSPGFEVNDLGFQTIADRRGLNFAMQYQQPTPKGIFQRYSFYLGGDYIYNFGGDMVEHDYFGSLNFLFRNFWSVDVRYGASPEYKNDRLTRGGPVTARPADANVRFRIRSDYTRLLILGLSHRRRIDATGEFDREYGLDLSWRPYPSITVSTGLNYVSSYDTDQYVDEIEDATAVRTFGSRYVFANVRQQLWESPFRLNWTFMPDFSLQLFAQPFLTAARFTDYKEFAEPGTFNFDVYGEDAGDISYDEAEEQFLIDPDGSGPASAFSISQQDFNFASIRGNAVLRWEFRPGRILFLVWQQDRSDFENFGSFDLSRDSRRMIYAPGRNTFLIKLAYWFS